MAAQDTRTPQEVALADAVNLVPGMIAESALFGVLSLVVMFSLFTILQQHNSTRSRAFMLTAITLMYTMSGIHWSLNIYTLMREIRDPRAWVALPIEITYQWSVIPSAALFINFSLSDIIVMWRACVVWTWSRRVTIPCCVFIASPLILAIIDVATFRPTQEQVTYEPHAPGLVALLISLLSNLWATSLIGYKAWFFRRNIQAYLGNAGTTSSAQSVLAILMESGFLYCIIWALFISSRIFSTGSFEHEAQIISDVVPQLVGLYPAIIIVLVSLQKTHCDRKFTYGSSGGSTAGSLAHAPITRKGINRSSEDSTSIDHETWTIKKTQSDDDMPDGDRLTWATSSVFSDTIHVV